MCITISVMHIIFFLSLLLSLVLLLYVVLLLLSLSLKGLLILPSSLNMIIAQEDHQEALRRS